MLTGEPCLAGAGGTDFYYLHVGLPCALGGLSLSLIFIQSE
ncbi:hypothetical protein SBC1_56220 (plasmid) [Caballeronia sp. SBC1]|nr:hypothetical protein SBC2_55900 [Caballeronia sp. SBC2]QIN65577.1 hypothetical protein SBC1_56220 [Caballeronia sp. SBC1]